MNRMSAIVVLALAMFAVAACTPGADAPEQAMEVSEPWARAVPAGAPVAAGYLAIRNRSGFDDRLVEARSGSAQRVEIHEMRHEQGVMRMRLMENGLPLPRGQTVALEPGGYHLMFIAPVDDFERQQVRVTLVFERASPVDVDLDVRPVGSSGHSGHRL